MDELTVVKRVASMVLNMVAWWVFVLAEVRVVYLEL